ncbi:aspartate-semialdehyde dehydrogenase [Pseudomonas sp. SIMBA_077]
MLPPILPLSVVPVTSQQDPVRPRPEIPAVVPTQASSGDSTINLKQHDADQAALLLREEQQRQQQREQEAHHPDQDEVQPASDGVVDGAPRQGLWIDIEV